MEIGFTFLLFRFRGLFRRQCCAIRSKRHSEPERPVIYSRPFISINNLAVGYTTVNMAAGMLGEDNSR